MSDNDSNQCTSKCSTPEYNNNFEKNVDRSGTKKCIQDHRNPIVKVNLPAQKLYLGAKAEEAKLVNNYQEHFRTMLEHERIEKRSGRAQAVWLVEDNVAKVIKIVKNLIKYFGFQNKNGVFLYPEEMLLLLETNRIEVAFNNHTLSIERAYEVVFKTTNINLSKYRIYKKLTLLGCKLIRFEQIDNRKLNKMKKNNMKRSLEEDTIECQATKRTKEHASFATIANVLEDSDQSETDYQNSSHATTFTPKQSEHVYAILNQNRKVMPRDTCDNSSSLKPDYCIFSPPNITKLEPDFNLFICKNNILEQRNFNSKVPSIYASCIDDVALYRFGNVHLPHI